MRQVDHTVAVLPKTGWSHLAKSNSTVKRSHADRVTHPIKLRVTSVKPLTRPPNPTHTSPSEDGAAKNPGVTRV